MKSITRLSLALIMFSLFSISYLVTSVSAQNCAGMGNPAAVASCWAQQTNTPGHPAGLIVPADISHCANLEATAARPACEAAAHSSMAVPAPFDDNLMGAAGGAGVMDPQGTSHDSKLSSTDVDNSPTCRSECDALHGTHKETQACYDKFPNRKSPKCRHGGVN